MKYDKDKIEIIVRDSSSYNDVSMKYHGYCNSKSLSKIRSFIFNNHIDTSHFNGVYKRTKYKIIDKICHVCGKVFKTKEGHVKEKTTCSYKC